MDEDRLRDFLDAVAAADVARGSFLGLLHLLIGRRITLADGTPVSAGQTWREVAALLKRVRWDRESAAELGLDPASLPPRDRERFWYAAIVRSGVDSPAAAAAAQQLAALLPTLGYQVVPLTGQPGAPAEKRSPPKKKSDRKPD